MKSLHQEELDLKISLKNKINSSKNYYISESYKNELTLKISNMAALIIWSSKLGEGWLSY